MTGMLLLFVLAPVAVFCGIGFLERSKTRSFARFFQHGDRISKFHFFATLTSSTAGLASTLLLIAVYGYLYGLGVFVWIVIFWWLTQWASQRTILRVEKLRPGFWKDRGTLHEFLGEMFGSTRIRNLAAFLSVLCFTLLLVAEVILSYRLVFAATVGNEGPVTEFPIATVPVFVHAAILIAVFLYTAIAGFRAVIRTDAIQFCIVGTMIVTIFALLGGRLPEIVSMHEAIFGSTVLESIINPVARDPFHFLLFFVLMNLCFWTAWWPVAMDQWHRCAATADVSISTSKSFGTAGYGAKGYVLILTASIVLLGAATRVYVAPGADIADPLPVFIRSIMPGGELALGTDFGTTIVAGLILMGLVAAVLSTLDTYILVITQSLVLDIFIARRTGDTLTQADKSPKLLNTFLPLAKRLAFLWLPVSLLGVWLISNITLDAFNVVYMAFSFQMAFVGVLLVALVGRRKSASAATASLSFGGIWCAVTFPLLITRLDKAMTGGDIDTVYLLLDMMFLNTVLVSLVAIGVYFVFNLFERARHTKA